MEHFNPPQNSYILLLFPVSAEVDVLNNMCLRETMKYFYLEKAFLVTGELIVYL